MVYESTLILSDSLIIHSRVPFDTLMLLANIGGV